MKENRRRFLGQIGGLTLSAFLASSRAIAAEDSNESILVDNRPNGHPSGSQPAQNIPGDEPDLQILKQMLKNKEPNIWLFTGDSITHGAKHTHGHRSYPEVFKERVRWEISRVRDIVINTGISGNAAGDILSDFEWRVARFHPDAVSVMVGTNDCAREGMTPVRYQQNVSELVRRIRALDAIPILHTPNPIILAKSPERRTLPEYIPVLRKLADKERVVLVDNYFHWEHTGAETSMENVFGKWLNDPLHPNQYGHQEIARLMFKTLDIFDPAAATCGGPYYEGEH